jgi:hypothetical protein
VHPLRRRLSPWSTRRSPKPVEKGEGNCGAGDWGGGREGPKNLAADDYRPEKTSVFLLHEIVIVNFVPVFAGASREKVMRSQYPRTLLPTSFGPEKLRLQVALCGATQKVH